MKPNVLFTQSSAPLISTVALARCKYPVRLQNCFNSLLKRGKPLKRLASRGTSLHRAEAAVLMRTCWIAGEISGFDGFHRHGETAEPHHPGGMVENSPAFQRWVYGPSRISPEGTAEAAAFWPCLAPFFPPSLSPRCRTVAAGRDLRRLYHHPSVETLGYCHLSLRDRGTSLANPP